MKEIVARRPLLLFAGGLVLGLTGLLHPANLLFLLAALAFFPERATRLVLTGGAAVGFLLTPTPLQPVIERSYVEGIGTVVNVPECRPYGSRFEITLLDRTWQATLRECADLSLGDRVKVRGIALPLREGSEDYLALHGVSGRLELLATERLSAGPFLWRWADAWRTSFQAFCDRHLSREAAQLTKALCFDMSGDLPRETSHRLKATGTVHLVSASGLHVFVLAFAVMAALSPAPIPRGAQLALVAVGLILYAAAAGLSPPVVRAALMSFVGSIAYLFRRERDPLSALALAASLYLVWQPRQVYDPGFQLSFVTVGAFALFLHPADSSLPLLLRGAYEALRVAWVAFVASAPIVAYHFGTISLISLPANLLVGAAASIAIVSALAAHLLSFLVLPLGVGVLALVTAPMVGWLLWTVEALADLPAAVLSVPGFSAYWLPVAYGLLLMTWRPRIVQP